MTHPKNDGLENPERATSDQRLGANAFRWKTILILGIAISWPFLAYKAFGPRPWDHSFDPSKFSVSMVRSNIEFKMFALTHWPPGTPRSDIDRSLLLNSGMHKRELEYNAHLAFGKNIDKYLVGIQPAAVIEYSRGNFLQDFVGGGGLRIFAFYDRNEKLIQMIYSSTVIYQ